MNDKLFTVGKIEDVPHEDPYNHGQPTQTVLVIYPSENQPFVYVEQSMQSHSMSMDEYNNICYSFGFPNFPSRNMIVEWIDDHTDDLNAIVQGHSIEWNGHNMKGRLTDDAYSAIVRINTDIDNSQFYTEDYWEFWNIDDWLGNASDFISASTTDDELERIADDLSTTAEDDNIVLSDDDILRYLTSARDTMRYWEDD